MAGALDRIMALCTGADACPISPHGCTEPLSDPAAELCDEKRSPVVAAPGLDESIRSALEHRCRSAGATLVTAGLRRHLAGVDIGLTVADYGIAETGTLVIDSSSEDLRLATMICDTHVVLLPVSRIHRTADELAPVLTRMMDRPADYTAFVTGASRTADIERVLALGVHGPLALHILLLES